MVSVLEEVRLREEAEHIQPAQKIGEHLGAQDWRYRAYTDATQPDTHSSPRGAEPRPLARGTVGDERQGSFTLVGTSASEWYSPEGRLGADEFGEALAEAAVDGLVATS
ncbi:hypothetical protein [Rhodococcus sp. 14C212]|uniref:hypothetical protein n=1 Tax=Rhodococcus sp. 14C212 TaxID=2711209 RepID=UPI001F0FEABC|nr:hypothetical protein [Rhodococcus sp. 14C212]